MQSTQNTFDGSGVVVLDERCVRPSYSTKSHFVKALEEETTFVTKDSGFDNDDVGDLGWGGFHNCRVYCNADKCIELRFQAAGACINAERHGQHIALESHHS